MPTPDVPKTYEYQHLIRDVSGVLSVIVQTQPTLLSIVGMGGRALAHEHEWPEDVLAPEQSTVTAGINAAATEVVVASALPYSVNAICRIEQDAETSELVRVTGVDSGTKTLTIVRGYGASTAAAIAANARLIVVSKPQPESSRASLKGDPTAPVMASNFTEIFDAEAVVSRSQSPVYGIGPQTGDAVGAAMNHQVERQLLLLSRRMNAALIYGRKVKKTAAAPGTMGGLLQFHEGSANIVDGAGAAISRKLLGDAMQRAIESGADGLDTLLCGPAQARNISNLYAGQLQIARQDTTLGQAIYNVMSDLPVEGFITRIVVDQSFPARKISLFKRDRVRLVPFRAMTDEASRAGGDDFEARRILGEYTAEFLNWKESSALIENLSAQVQAA